MDSFQFWLYVIIGAVYLISRMRKKSGGQPEELPEPDEQRESGRTAPQTRNAPQKTLTFEELLREISASKQPKEEPVVDYDDDLEEEGKVIERVNYDSRRDDKVYEAYEEAKKQAFFRPSLEETMKIENTVVSFGKFKEFERAAEVNLAAEYLKNFGDPGSIRKAVVMSEILKRKF